MNKSLAIAVLTVFSGAAYAGSALEQAGPGAMEFQLPEPVAVEVVRDDASCVPPSLFVGSSVATENDSGTVTEVFADGTVRVKFDNGSFIINAKKLGIGVGCHMGVCGKARVANRLYDTGTVTEVFTNGIARVVFDYFNFAVFINVKELGVSVKCHAGICKNSRVASSRYGRGTVLEVFTDGTVTVAIDHDKERYRRTFNVKDVTAAP